MLEHHEKMADRQLWVARSSKATAQAIDLQVEECGTIKTLIVPDFLSPAAQDRLLEFARQNEDDFCASQTVGNRPNHRRSVVIYNPHQWGDLFRSYLLERYHKICTILDIPAFEAGRIETQLTATRHEEFFRPHRDSDKNLRRRITFVYYFNTRPKKFSGGNLNLYESETDHPERPPGIRAINIAPRNNTLLIFPSNALHEVTPVSCDSHRFIDSRFTINGWIWDKDDGSDTSKQDGEISKRK